MFLAAMRCCSLIRLGAKCRPGNADDYAPENFQHYASPRNYAAPCYALYLMTAAARNDDAHAVGEAPMLPSIAKEGRIAGTDDSPHQEPSRMNEAPGLLKRAFTWQLDDQ